MQPAAAAGSIPRRWAAIPAAADSRALHHGGPGVIGGDGGGGAGGGGTLRRGGSGKASRSIEDIKLVFDRNKGSIYTLYNRALREDPTLQGKVVVKLTIAPSGQVLECQLVSSELRSPDLEAQGAVAHQTVRFWRESRGRDGGDYPIDFLPS